jgi:hypothetical protein
MHTSILLYNHTHTTAQTIHTISKPRHTSIHVCVCVYIYIHTYLHIYVHAYKHIYRNTHTHNSKGTARYVDNSDQAGLIGTGSNLTIYGTSKPVPYGSEAEYEHSDSRISYNSLNASTSSYMSQMTGRPVIAEFSKRVYLGT